MNHLCLFVYLEWAVFSGAERGVGNLVGWHCVSRLRYVCSILEEERG